MSRPGLAYAQARLHARLADRPDPAQWQLLESSGDYVQCLDLAAKTALRGWVAQLGPTSTAHQVEQVLRATWRDRVSELAGWLPDAWQPAILWLIPLPYLRVFEFRRGQTPPPDWLQQDRAFARLWAETTLAPAATDDPWGLTVLARDTTTPVADLWQAHFLSLLPHRGDGAVLLRDIGPLLARYLGRPVTGDAPQPETGVDALETRLHTLFRTRPQTASAMIAYLGLLALDAGRLRAALLRRLAFAPPPLAGAA